MKFLNPETGHGADGVVSAKCSAWPDCIGCPVAKMAMEAGFIDPYSCVELVLRCPEKLPQAMAALGYYPVETFRERLEREHPECIYINGCGVSGCKGCPKDYGYEKKEPVECSDMTCAECWDRIIPSSPHRKKKRRKRK